MLPKLLMWYRISAHHQRVRNGKQLFHHCLESLFRMNRYEMTIFKLSLKIVEFPCTCFILVGNRQLCIPTTQEMGREPGANDYESDSIAIMLARINRNDLPNVNTTWCASLQLVRCWSVANKIKLRIETATAEHYIVGTHRQCISASSELGATLWGH